jgi:hypothetical protein
MSLTGKLTLQTHQHGPTAPRWWLALSAALSLLALCVATATNPHIQRAESPRHEIQPSLDSPPAPPLPSIGSTTAGQAPVSASPPATLLQPLHVSQPSGAPQSAASQPNHILIDPTTSHTQHWVGFLSYPSNLSATYPIEPSSSSSYVTITSTEGTIDVTTTCGNEASTPQSIAYSPTSLPPIPPHSLTCYINLVLPQPSDDPNLNYELTLSSPL